MSRLAVLVALMVALVGCAVPVAVSPADSQPIIGPAQQSGVIPAPASISIPSIGAESSLIPLGLNDDRTLAVPPITAPLQASWFIDGNAGVIPGEVGPAVVAGHISGRVDGASVPGVFARLAELNPGDLVEIERHGAPPLRWQVVTVGEYQKSAFPTEAVWGDTDGPTLRLITCGGALGVADDGTRSYDSNVIVFAVPA